MVTLLMPCPLTELIESIPAMVVNCFSKGVATAAAMVSGLAPGSSAETWMVGKSTLGSDDTGSSRKLTTPKINMPTITRIVITGRRTKSSDRFTSSALASDRHLCTGDDAQLPLGDDLLARLETRRDDGIVAVGPVDAHFAHLGRHVASHHEHELAGRPGLYRLGRHDQRSLLLVEPDAHVDELARPESVVLVLELSP